ncbi:MAG TPA: recombinase family protein, partial [Cyanobacteria bacterium UBA11166]|nr:recombinase family protein [Cyanobacteria bacterium UBA11166]
MKIIAYSYSNPLIESPPETTIWGWEIDRIYQDLGGRIELEQLLKDCQNQPTEYLLIRRLEELGNGFWEICDRISQIEATGVKIIAISQPYTSVNPQPELLQLLTEIQRETNSRRLREGHAKNRIKTLPPPGKAPYGYRRGKDRYIIDRSTAPVVKDFFEQFILYGCLRRAVRYLEKKYNKKISVSTGHRWLTNPIYRGNIAYQNGEIISDTHSPILNREEAAQIDRLLRRNRRLPSRTASAPRSLAGLIVCGECDSSMTVTSVTRPRKNGEYLYLRPINCPKINKCKSFPYQEVLERTIQSICEELPRAVAELNMPNLDLVKQSLTRKI